MPTEPQTVSVVVSSYNQLGPLKLALESFRFQVTPPLEVIVADDGSTDGTLEWLEAQEGGFPFRLIPVTRAHDGYRLASLQNLGARQATGTRLQFTNADVVHCPASVSGHAKLPGDMVGAGIIKSISARGTAMVTLETVRDFRELLKLAGQFPERRTNAGCVVQDPNLDPLPVWGGNFSVPKEAFDKVGGFDEGYVGWGGEDGDLVKRCQKQAGCKIVWVTNSVVYHLSHPVQNYHREQLGTIRYMKKIGK
jgi:glycosyltransferase involved in cell wall biosynthesis